MSRHAPTAQIPKIPAHETDEGIRMDRNEQIRTDFFRLHDPVSKFYKIVAVSNEHAPHVRFSVHKRLQPLGDCQA
jgi:hypothetical protein